MSKKLLFKGIMSPDEASNSSNASNSNNPSNISASNSPERTHPRTPAIAETSGKEGTKSNSLDASNRSDTGNTRAPATESAIVETSNNREKGPLQKWGN